jgi:tetratricopeptide (TPR) repeat protein
MKYQAEQKAQLCQAVMNTATNLARGAIDCLVPCMGKHGNFLMIDPRSLEAVNVPSGSGVVKVLVTKTKQKTPVDQKECAARVATCKEALAAVNRHTDSAKEALRDVEMSELQDTCDKGGLGEVALRCARHVLTENRRCQDAAAALKRRDFAAVGKLMHASHVSMKEDYGARSDELDALVACACSQDGVLGSRMVANATCVLSIVDAGKIEAVKAALSEAYSSKFGEACDHTTSDASAGARRVDMALYFPEQHGYECIVQANILKAQGNECFKAGEPSKALEKYNRIPLAIKGLVKKQGGGGGGGMGAMMGMPNNKDEQALTDEQRNEVNTLWQTCHINRAMCYIKLEKWDKGVDACTEAISSGSDDVKAYFRRGKCYRHLGELDKAREDLNGVAARNPDDINVQRELLEVEKRQKMQDDRAKKTFVKMFA